MSNSTLSAQPAVASGSVINPALPQSRVASVDVYRGFVMLLMMAEVLSFYKVSEALPESAFWRFMNFHQSHVPWTWLALHDMIQPSFTFFGWSSITIFHCKQEK